MKNGRRGLIFKWASAVGSALVIGGGDVVGIVMRKTLCASGMIQEQAEAMRWLRPVAYGSSACRYARWHMRWARRWRKSTCWRCG